jgi:hypothetical protein
MYKSLADVRAWLRLKDKSRKMFHMIMTEKISVFLNFELVRWGGGADQLPALRVRTWLEHY